MLWRCRIERRFLPLFIITVIFPVASPLQNQNTSFSFLFLPGLDRFLLFGNSTIYDPSTHSLTILHPARPVTTPSCVKIYYKDKVRMQTNNVVASFSTAFTFTIVQPPVDQSTTWQDGSHGFGFAIHSEYLVSTLHSPNLPVNMSAVKYFAVKFDTSQDWITEDPSDNHIAVNINNIKAAYTYNLCEGNKTRCAFPWTGRTYTAWIDYNGNSLEVWFANGSLREGVVKPSGSGLIKVPDLNLMSIMDDNMYVGFIRRVPPFSLDSHKLLSWNFNSSTLEATTSTSSRFMIISSLIVFFAVILVVMCSHGYWSVKKTDPKPELGFDHLIGLRRFTFQELKKATENFSEGALLGKGGSGSVYKGTLGKDLVVAVKKLHRNIHQEFLAEVCTISQIRHRNLVHLQGWCHDKGQFLLVFENMGNGSLDQWLFGQRKSLSWELRFSILAGVASAVEYLHEEWVQCVLHRDIKSSNVMLDDRFNAHLGDFGLARLVDHDKVTKTTAMGGTFGYMAPEMHFTGRATKESDVYSFGVLMLEVLCGRKPVNLQVEDPDEEFMLVQLVWRSLEGGNILSAVDPKLMSGSATSPTTSLFDGEGLIRHQQRVVRLLHLGLQCCLLDPGSRSSMRVVKQVICRAVSEEEDAINLGLFMPDSSVPSESYASLGVADDAESMAAGKVDDGVSVEVSRFRDTMRRRFVTN